MNLKEKYSFRSHGAAMQTGASIKSYLGRLIPHFLFIFMNLLLLVPGLPGKERYESTFANPFALGADRRLLQSYIQSTLKEEKLGPEINTLTQEVFFLFRLFDYDRTGFLDGLEMMQLLSDYNSYHAPRTQADEEVISVVDFLLQNQDLNQDGLLAPSELLSAPLPQSQDASNNDALQNEEVVKDPSPDELNKGAEEQKAENPNDMEPEQPQQEVTVSEEVMHKEAYEQQEQQILQVPLTNLEVDWEVPVHQGQPEI